MVLWSFRPPFYFLLSQFLLFPCRLLHSPGAGGFGKRESCKLPQSGFNYDMPTLERIENDVKQLPKADQEALRDWLENLLEDELEFTEEFKAKIERGEQDIREGHVRIRKVQAGQ
jgi:hypothetical protein